MIDKKRLKTRNKFINNYSVDYASPILLTLQSFNSLSKKQEQKSLLQQLLSKIRNSKTQPQSKSQKLDLKKLTQKDIKIENHKSNHFKEKVRSVRSNKIKLRLKEDQRQSNYSTMFMKRYIETLNISNINIGINQQKYHTNTNNFKTNFYSQLAINQQIKQKKIDSIKKLAGYWSQRKNNSLKDRNQYRIKTQGRQNLQIPLTNLNNYQTMKKYSYQSSNRKDSLFL